MSGNTDRYRPFFFLGFLSPAIYVMLIPGSYASIWAQLRNFIFQPAFGTVVIWAALIKSFLYLIRQPLEGRRPETAKRADKAVFAIHVGTAILVLFIVISGVLAAIARNQAEFSAMQVFFNFLTSEFLVFPVLASAYLYRVLKSPKEGVITPLALAFAIYIDVMMVTLAANLTITAPGIGDPRNLRLPELIGANLFFSLLAITVFVGSPGFWESTSLYTLDIAPPPSWVAAIVIAAASAYFYRTLRKTTQDEGEIPGTQLVAVVTSPLRVNSVAVDLVAASMVTLVVFVALVLTFPQNVAGRMAAFVVIVAAIAAVSSFRTVRFWRG